jgi:hypothetical protein
MRRTVIFLAGAALVASGLHVPASAQDAPPPPPVVPEVVVVEDPFGDANGLNGQGGVVPADGDNGTPQDLGNASDIGRVWFSADELTVTAHVETELPSPGTQALRYDVFTTPGEGTAAANTNGCAWFTAIVEGKAQGQQTTWVGPSEAKFFDACNDGTNWFNNGVPAELAFHTLEGGTGVISITAPKDASPLLTTGATLTATTAGVRLAYGVSGTSAGTVFYIDNTKPGTDYVVTGAPEVDEEEPPAEPPGCKKGKGKKKGCKKKGA